MVKVNRAAEAGLSAERVRAALHYDPETGVFTWLVINNWGKQHLVGTRAGCPRPHPDNHRFIKFDGRAFAEHRLAFLYMTGEWPKDEVDHRDTDGLNNKWENLREATLAQNRQNRGLRPNNTSGHKGISWFKGTKRWRVRVAVNGKRGGPYADTLEEAIALRDRLIAKMHGEFART